jgi:hypothetical protein
MAGSSEIGCRKQPRAMNVTLAKMLGSAATGRNMTANRSLVNRCAELACQALWLTLMRSAGYPGG